MNGASASYRFVLALALVAAVADAKSIIVAPAAGTPLQDAIDAAAPGDVIRATGVFYEAIVIDKSLTILGPATLDPGCGPAVVLTIAADDVKLRRVLAYGGAQASIAAQGRSGLRLKQVFVVSQPFAGGCPDAQYGIDIDGGGDIGIDRSEAIRSGPGHSFATAFIRVRNVGPDSRVFVKKSFSNLENANGIIVEDSADTPGGPPAVRLRGNQIVTSATGILLRNSDGIEVINSYIGGNTAVGIHVDATSDGNLLSGNQVFQNTLDVLDEGSGNCWRRTTFQTGTIQSCP